MSTFSFDDGPSGFWAGKSKEKRKEKRLNAPTAGPPLADAIYLANPFTNRQAPNVTRVLIYVLPGNPGLIEFYRPFLTRLYGTLQDREIEGVDGSKTKIVWEVAGRSMGGFELRTSTVGKEQQWIDGSPPGGALQRGLFSSWAKIQKPRVYTLNEQIEFMESRLRQMVKGQGNVKVILIGHSVGGYILLEILRRHRERLQAKVDLKLNESLTASEQDDELDAMAGICLFPTIMDISESSKGIALMRFIRALGSTLPFVVSSLAHLLVFVLPFALFDQLVSRVSGMSGRPKDVSVSWISSRVGVKQTLHMGADEMTEITTDKWDSEIWGAAEPSPTGVSRPKLFFYFGKKDHWVADRTRDDIMRARGRLYAEIDDWKPWMEIDKLDTPHGFCIDHSVPIADKCKEFIDRILEETMGGTGRNVLNLSSGKRLSSLESEKTSLSG